uniref:Uncharacterized protein n=1 Tax=Rhizophora mucronata TaxID=61149 RepID=A0A2P2J2A3_RHIMU
MDNFQELEPELIENMSKNCPIKTVGPLCKSRVSEKTTVSGDFFKADDCIEWLDAKPPSSVVYISFGSVVYLKQGQHDEIAHGLMSSGCNLALVLPLITITIRALSLFRPRETPRSMSNCHVCLS